MLTKYVFVTGGVVSSLGKGITAASLGRLLKARGLKVSMQKLDPYINIDPSLMSPYQHGEVFVTDDGLEADLDLGHYERFVDENLQETSSASSGKIYWTVLTKEREGGYNGGTVQVIPHITNEIKRRIQLTAKKSGADVVIIEIGGTVGDIEGLPFLEAIRQFGWEVGSENCCYVHVTLLPYIGVAGEIKTKPTQHSVKELRSIGIQPDVIVCRSEQPISRGIKAKIALFCNVLPENVIQNTDTRSLYDVPLMLEEEGFADNVCKRLQICAPAPDLDEWRAMVKHHLNLTKSINIKLVGKYVELHDAYISTCEALTHAGIVSDTLINVDWIQTEHIKDENVALLLADADGIIAPGGFGERGAEGNIIASRFAREHKIPFFGIGIGMQLAVVEFAQNVLGLREAHSTEVSPQTPYPVVYKPSERNDAMQLGAKTCIVKEDTKVFGAYGKVEISERHRNKYEVNNEFIDRLGCKGMIVSATSHETGYAEAIELVDHPWYVGVSFLPEFKSRPNRAHPLYREFIAAACSRRDRK